MQLIRADALTHKAEGHGLAEKATRYVAGCLASGFPFAANIDTDCYALQTPSTCFPVTVNDRNISHNSYVVSPQNMYTRYATYEAESTLPRSCSWAAAALAKAAGAIFGYAALDTTVHVNNWLLSTQLFPASFDTGEVEDITSLLLRQFPQHQIVWRSLNHTCNNTLIATLEKTGYLFIPSRQIYITDAHRPDTACVKRTEVRKDRKLLNSSSYEIVPGHRLSYTEIERVAALYHALYIEKYCPLNPQYTPHWFHCGIQDQWLEVYALRTSDGGIHGALGLFGDENVLTSPIVGYDTAQPQETGLYRQLTALCLKTALERKLMLNASAGASNFKAIRGGMPEIEYSAIYINHLPRWKRNVWHTIRALLNHIAVPLMRHYKL